MKKLLCILVILTLSLAAVSALAEADTISAIGSATVTLVPDQATFSVGVTTQDSLITTAQTANNTAMQAIIDALLSQGVAREDIQTQWYSVYPIYDYQESYPTTTGYEVSNTITVFVHELDHIPFLLDAAVEAGANNVNSLSFLSSEQAAAYDQALKAAVQDALRKASLMAQAIGREAGAVLSLTENSNASIFYADARDYALSSVAPVSIENGTVSVTAEVVAVVELK